MLLRTMASTKLKALNSICKYVHDDQIDQIYNVLMTNSYCPNRISVLFYINNVESAFLKNYIVHFPCTVQVCEHTESMALVPDLFLLRVFTSFVCGGFQLGFIHGCLSSIWRMLVFMEIVGAFERKAVVLQFTSAFLRKTSPCPESIFLIPNQTHFFQHNKTTVRLTHKKDNGKAVHEPATHNQ